MRPREPSERSPASSRQPDMAKPAVRKTSQTTSAREIEHVDLTATPGNGELQPATSSDDSTANANEGQPQHGTLNEKTSSHSEAGEDDSKTTEKPCLAVAEPDPSSTTGDNDTVQPSANTKEDDTPVRLEGQGIQTTTAESGADNDNTKTSTQSNTQDPATEPPKEPEPEPESHQERPRELIKETKPENEEEDDNKDPSFTINIPDSPTPRSPEKGKEQEQEQTTELTKPTTSPTSQEPLAQKLSNRKSLRRIFSMRQSSRLSLKIHPSLKSPTNPSSSSKMMESPSSPGIKEEKEGEMRDKHVEAAFVRLEGRKWEEGDNESLFCY